MADYSGFLYSPGGSDHFYERITPTSDQRSYLQDQHNALSEILKPRLNNELGFGTETWIQGSYKYGTLLRPFEGEEFDLDLGFYFVWQSVTRLGVTPIALRSAVQAQLEAHAQRETEILNVVEPPKVRCCRVHYKQQFHIDVPVYHLDRTRDYRELATGKNEWEHSDPKTLYTWLRDRVLPEDFSQLRRLICYIKAWARLSIISSARPASILLTVLVVEAYFALRRDLPSRDDQALVAIVHQIATRLRQSAVVQNPVDQNENLNRLDATELTVFMQNLDTFAIVGGSALSAPSKFASGMQWARLFRYMMPLPIENDALMLKEAASASPGALVVQPSVDVTVKDSAGRNNGTYRNGPPGPVLKNSTLHFRITNDGDFPLGSTYTWTVRNREQEAADSNDLGHEKSGVGLVSNDQNTLYNGKHFMDVKVSSSDGRLLGFRRVPVHVKGSPLAKKYSRGY